jgi:hypothetical protein
MIDDNGNGDDIWIDQIWPIKIVDITTEIARRLPDKEFRELRRRIRRNVVKRSPGEIGAKRHAAKIDRRVTKIRRPKNSFRVPKAMLPFKLRPSRLLDSICVDRRSLWVPPLKRRAHDSINLKNFSFLDAPIETLANLQKLVSFDATHLEVEVNFEDDHVTDVGSFLVFGLMRREMTACMSGGAMKLPLKKVLDAAGLRHFLRMGSFGYADQSDVWPFRIRERAIGKKDALSTALSAQRMEKVIDDLTDTIDEWLDQLDHDGDGFELTKAGRGKIARCLGEILDNAERHSVPESERSGGWYVAGFMARRKAPGTDEAIYVCHLSIVSLGSSVGETLLSCEDGELLEKISNYCRTHRKHIAPQKDSQEVLATVCALQDGVSRKRQDGDNPASGVGLMEMIELVNELGGTEKTAYGPKITIISGNACVMIRDKYVRGLDGKSKTSPRTVWFNATNSLEAPPDSDYVTATQQRFPGTIVSMRFVLDGAYLAERADND